MLYFHWTSLPPVELQNALPFAVSFSRSVLPSAVTISHMCTFKFKWIKIKQSVKCSLPITLAAFHTLSSHVCSVATILHSTDADHFRHCGEFYWTELVQVVHSDGKNGRSGAWMPKAWAMFPRCVTLQHVILPPPGAHLFHLCRTRLCTSYLLFSPARAVAAYHPLNTLSSTLLSVLISSTVLCTL